MKPERVTSFAGVLLKLLAFLFGVGLLLYILVVAWMHYHLSGQAVSISQAAGIPADAERVLKGFLSWLLALALVPALIRLTMESLNPRRSSSTVILKLIAFMTIGFASALLPYGLRSLRGVDARGLPIHMRQSDPSVANWWDPNGNPVLFFSAEKDGSLRFWNRPGTTPDTGLACLPVTREQRSLWERKVSETAAEDQRKKQEAANEAARRDAIRQEELKALAVKVQQAADEKARAERESQERAHALELAALHRTQKEQDSRSSSERDSLRKELEKSKAEAKTAAARDRAIKAQTDSTKDSSATRNSPPEWRAKRILPAKYLYVHGFPSRSMEIHLPYECEIEVQGLAPRIFPPGTTIVSLGGEGNFRVRSRITHEFDILVRPFTR